jgi:hypothetical protein
LFKGGLKGILNKSSLTLLLKRRELKPDGVANIRFLNNNQL